MVNLLGLIFPMLLQPTDTYVLLAFLLLAVGYVIITGYASVDAFVKAEPFSAEIRAPIPAPNALGGKHIQLARPYKDDLAGHSDQNLAADAPCRDGDAGRPVDEASLS